MKYCKYLLFIVFLFIPFISQAESNILRTRLDDITLEKGFTFSSIDGNLQVGVQPNSLSKRQHVNFSIKPLNSADFNLTDENLVSNLYSFDIHAKKAIKVKKVIWLSLKYNVQDAGYERVLKFWDNNQQTWRALPSTDKKKKQKINAGIAVPYAIVGVFAEEKNYQVGYASWYDYIGAASTEYPYGSIVKVINLSNNKSCEVTIKDYGPFIEGRVIDLPREAFAEIADLGAGVVQVKVIPIFIP